MQIEAGLSVERKPWPGPFGIRTDGERYIYDALQPFLTSWRWDDPDRRGVLTRLLNADQLAVWSIWNVDGQIDNGGSVQAVSNSYGELCEDAIIGFAQLGLQDYAQLMDRAFSCYERPISRDRGERLLMLERLAGLSGDPHDFSRFGDVNYISKIYTNCGKVSGPAERPYWEMKRVRPIEAALCLAIDARRGSFFSGVPAR